MSSSRLQQQRLITGSFPNAAHERVWSLTGLLRLRLRYSRNHGKTRRTWRYYLCKFVYVQGSKQTHVAQYLWWTDRRRLELSEEVSRETCSQFCCYCALFFDQSSLFQFLRISHWLATLSTGRSDRKTNNSLIHVWCDEPPLPLPIVRRPPWNVCLTASRDVQWFWSALCYLTWDFPIGNIISNRNGLSVQRLREIKMYYAAIGLLALLCWEIRRSSYVVRANDRLLGLE